MAYWQPAVRSAAFSTSIGVETDLGASSRLYAGLATVESSLAYPNPDGIGTGVGTIRNESPACRSELTESREPWMPSRYLHVAFARHHLRKPAEQPAADAL